MKKLKAFTLIEVLISMALLGVLLMIGTFIFRNINQYQTGYFEQVESTYSTLIVYDLLENSCREACSYEILKGNLLRLYDSQDEIFSYYHSKGDLLLRFNRNQLDSLSFEPIVFETINQHQFQATDTSNFVYTFSLNKNASARFSAYSP